ncbi:MAG: DNA polymerase III subunit alpha, partial [Halioglobus sp.]|nr:DNA polymerase III subunit alpha [Halioglobus sp.]
KGDVEDVGLVKFDFLGLRTLTIIDWAVRMIDEARERCGETPLDIDALPLDDEASFELLKSGNTTAVFQLESRGMKELITDLRPDCFEDIVALVALYRPGPLQSGMVENFINRKHGREAISYPDPQYQHERLKPILQSTYGIILYQEQVMQIARELAGYTLGEADVLRRAMGKKSAEVMARQRAVFQDGAKAQGIDADLAMKIFDLVEKFAGYGFNKSHSAAYALVSYQTAWLKAHYPAQFMAAVMSSELDNTDKIVLFVDECKRLALTLKLPDVNAGRYMFTVDEQGAIIYGLGAIKGLGEGPVQSILAARETGGAFTDLFDFCARTDPRKVNRRAIEALIRSGAFDSLGVERWILMASLDDAIRTAEQSAANRDSGMADLFGDVLPGPEAGSEEAYARFLHAKPWSDKERLGGERDTLGLYITGHPIDEYQDEVRRFAPNRIADLRDDRSASQVIVGLVMETRSMNTQRGAMGVMKLDDSSGQIEVTLFSEAFAQYRELMLKDTIVIAEGRISVSDKTQKLEMRANSLRSLEQARQSYAQDLTIEVDAERADDRFAELLEQTLASATGGNCPVSLIYRQRHNRARIRLGERWQVIPSDDLIRELRTVVGTERVFLQYQ